MPCALQYCNKSMSSLLLTRFLGHRVAYPEFILCFEHSMKSLKPSLIRRDCSVSNVLSNLTSNRLWRSLQDGNKQQLDAPQCVATPELVIVRNLQIVQHMYIGLCYPLQPLQQATIAQIATKMQCLHSLLTKDWTLLINWLKLADEDHIAEHVGHKHAATGIKRQPPQAIKSWLWYRWSTNNASCQAQSKLHNSPQWLSHS